MNASSFSRSSSLVRSPCLVAALALCASFVPSHAPSETSRTQPVAAKTTVAAEAPEAVVEEISWTSERARAVLDASQRLNNRDGVEACLSLLRSGCDMLAAKTGYTATLDRQERVAGTLHESERVELKLRHEPMGVYMKWLTGDRGRELLWVDKQNEGRMVVRLGGLKGRFLPAINLDPWGTRAMAQSRYNISKTGLLELARMVAGFRESDLRQNRGVLCELEKGRCDDRDSYAMDLNYTDPAESPVYRRTMLHIDCETLLPVCIWNYTWPSDNLVRDADAIDAATLIEYYHYTDLQFESQLAEVNFSRENPEYRFR